MNVYVAGLLGFAGVLLVLAGIHNKGTELFTAVTGSGTSGNIAGQLPTMLGGKGGGAPTTTGSAPAAATTPPAGGHGPVVST